MATQLFLTGSAVATELATWSSGNNDAKLNGSASGWTSRNLSTSRGAGVVSTSTSTVAGPTSGIEAASSGTPFVWTSAPLDADVTISGSITWNIWAAESAMASNVAINGQLSVIDGATGAFTLIDKTARTAEVAVTTRTANNFSETPASGVACKRGDRLRVVIFGDDSVDGNMASGGTFTLGYAGTSAAADGDTYLTLTENLTFVSEPAGTTIYPTDTASPVSTASVDREAWTSRGAGVQTDVTNTATGYTAPIQVTDTAGGTVVDWFTKQLTAFTLGGAVRVNARGLTSASNTAAPAVEIARVDSDGTNPTVWAIATRRDGYTTGETAVSFIASGDDLSISDGQRLRIRFFIDDAQIVAMTTARTSTLYYAGTSGGASGDTYLTFTQTLTEFSSGTNAAAQLASGTGAANNASVSLSPSTVGLASGTGGAPNAVVITGIATNAQAATGTGSALAATVLLAVSALLATGTGTGHQASVTVAPTAGHATGSGTAYNATVSVAAATNAAAELASGTGTAYNATVLTAKTVSAELAAGTGSAHAAVPAVAGAPNIGTGTGNAGAPAPAIAVNALLASGTGAAEDATAEEVAGIDIQVAQAVCATNSGGATTVSVTVTAPTAGRRLVLTLGAKDDATNAASPPDGTWTEIVAEQTQTGSTPDLKTRAWHKIASGSEGTSLSVSLGATIKANLCVYEIYDASGGTLVLTADAGGDGIALAGNAGSTTTSVATGTMASALEKIVLGFIHHNAIPSCVEDGDLTEDARAQSTGDTNSTRSRLTASSLITSDTASKTHSSTLGGAFAWNTFVAIYGVSDTSVTDANAEVATGTGAANNAVGTIATNAGLAAGTGAANNATVTAVGITNASAGLASGTGTALNAAPSVGAKPGLAAGTGTAHNPAPAVGANAGQGTGSGAAGAIDATVAGAPNIATGTGTASGPSIAIGVNVALASGTGTAYNATASTASTTDAAAGLASGTGVANGSNPAVAPNTGTGSGSGVAGDLDIAIAVNALLASGTGTANGATISTTSATQASADVAAGTGAAHAASCAIAPTAGLGTGSGTAYNVTTTASKLADAGIATGTGLARNASVLAASAPNIATGTGAANGVDAAIATTGGLAAGTGQARQPAAALSGSSGSASGSGAAGAPAPAIGSRPGFASGTGAAHDPTVALTGDASVNAGVATGSGVAWPAFALGYTPPTESEWTNKAVQYLGRKTYAMADVARGYGRAYNAYVRWDDDELAMILLLAQ